MSDARGITQNPFAEPDTDEVEPESAPTGLTPEQLDELLTRHDQRNAETLRAILQGTQRQQPLQADDPLPELNVDVIGLPHPAHDPEGFNKGYIERLNKSLTTYVQAATQRVATMARGEASQITSFEAAKAAGDAMLREARPDLPADLLEFAALKYANQLRAQGLDTEAALMRDTLGTAQAVLDIAEDYEEAWGIGGTRVESSRNRTGGIPTPSGRLPRKPIPREQPPENLTDLLKAEQTRLHLY